MTPPLTTAALLSSLLAAAATAAALGLPPGAQLRLRSVVHRAPVPGGVRAPDGRPLLVLLAPGTVRGPDSRRLLVLFVLAFAPGLWLFGPAGAVLLAAAGLAILLFLRRRAARRAAVRERHSAVEACSALAAELRAGRSPAEALEVAAGLAHGPSRDVLVDATAAARLGGDVPAALRSSVGRASASPEVLRGLAACWEVCARAGTGLAASADRLADGLRAREVQERAVESALAGPRASATLLALLPLVGVALAAGLGARPAHVLLHTPVGVGCLLAGTGLDLLGLWWTARLVARAAGRCR